MIAVRHHYRRYLRKLLIGSIEGFASDILADRLKRLVVREAAPVGAVGMLAVHAARGIAA